MAPLNPMALAASDASTRASGGQPGSRALDDELELCECGEDAEDKFAGAVRKGVRDGRSLEEACEKRGRHGEALPYGLSNYSV